MKPILVAVDGSKRALAVLKRGVLLAERLDAKLVLMRAFGLPVEVSPELYYGKTQEQVIKVLQDQASTELREVSKSAPTGFITEQRVELGTAWEEICRVAKEIDAGLVVIGSHGYKFVDRVLGTTAARVVNHIDRSVLVVRE